MLEDVGRTCFTLPLAAAVPKFGQGLLFSKIATWLLVVGRLPGIPARLARLHRLVLRFTEYWVPT